MDLLKQLSEMPGAPGREEHVRALVLEHVKEHVDEWSEDAMGNLICVKRAGKEGAKRRNVGGKGGKNPERHFTFCTVCCVHVVCRVGCRFATPRGCTVTTKDAHLRTDSLPPNVRPGCLARGGSSARRGG